MAGQYNLKNPGVKRILQEVKEMQKAETPDYIAEPLESDLFEWHFAIRGPADTEFEGGVYCGRIVLPAEYPFKPPAFMFLTPTGRFEVGTKICLSISQHHPEHWQPSWSVRLALTALIAFMPSKAEGALGSLDYTKEERRVLAIKSRTNPPKYGSPERQALIDRLHAKLLEGAPPIPDQLKTPADAYTPRPVSASMQQTQATVPPNLGHELRNAENIVSAAVERAKGDARGSVQGEEFASSERSSPGCSVEVERERNGLEERQKGIPNEIKEASPSGLETQAGRAIERDITKGETSRSKAGSTSTEAIDNQGPRRRAAQLQSQQEADPGRARAHQPSVGRVQSSPSLEDRVLTILAVVLAICIAYLLLKKIAKNYL